MSSTRRRRRGEAWTAWLFAGPGVALLGLFLVVPFLLASWLSFTDQRLVPHAILGTRFVGLRNYVRLLGDGDFLRALRTNLYFVAVVTPVQSALALGLAIAVNRRLAGTRFYRTVYFMPVATTMVVVTTVWTLMYAPGRGLVNQLVGTVTFGGVGPQDWLGDPRLVLPAVMVLSVWQGVGFQMLVFLAGLQGISHELYEAAILDGATPWQRFRFVTLPMLRNTTVFVLVTTTIYAFQLFTQVQMIASSGAVAPASSYRTVVMLMVQEGFRNGKVGYASALSVVFFLLVLAISMTQRFLMREERQIA